MRNTKWIYKCSENIEKTEENLKIDKDVLNLLHNRGIFNEENIYKFLNPDLNDIEDPFLLADLERGIDRVLEAKNRGEEIWIYGDYDVDGITSTSLCYLAFQEIGIKPKYYIPLRDEGYGLNKEAMKYIRDEGGKVVITVDCGISSHVEINFANELGLDIIVTDHHEINNGNPPAYAVINPKREDNKFKFKSLAGVGTAFMFVLGLFTKLGRREEAFKYLDIVAIGTVADIVPLLGENRIFTKYGMEQLKRSNCLGINMLIKTIFEDYKERKFSTYDIGFIIAPIFNAAGRLEDAKRAVELFIEQDHRICTQIINELLKKNSERKEIQEEIFQKAVDEIESAKLYENSVIVVAKEGFHHGVIGIVASKILDRYYKPTIIMEIKPEEGIATASCRSIEGFNIIEALNSMKTLFTKYGGHAGAAGFSIPIDKIEKFSILINDYAKKEISETNLIKPVKIDIDIPVYKISYDFIEKISQLEPFGFGNSSPIFSLNDCEIFNVRAIGKEKNHIMFNIRKDILEIRNCVWFNSEDVFTELLELKKVDIAFKLKLEIYKDRYQYKMYVEDIQLPNHSESEFEKYQDLHATVFPIETVIYTRRKIELNEFRLDFFEDRIEVIAERQSIGELDSQTSYLLTMLKKYYNYEFEVKLKDVILKDENYNIHILITKKEKFESYSIKESDIFKDIKRYLIGDFPYNSIQRKILSAIFRDKENVFTDMKKGRGVGTLVRTIKLYYESIGKRVFVSKNNTIIDGYDFYIVFNPENIDKSYFSNKRYLIISEKDEDYKNCKRIIDIYEVPKNIIFVSEDKLKDKKNIFSNSLPISLRKEIIKNLKNYKELYSTEDFLLYV